MTVTTDTAPNSTTEGSDEAPVPGTWRGVLAPLSVFASSRDRRLLARPGDGVPRTRPLHVPGTGASSLPSVVEFGAVSVVTVIIASRNDGLGRL